MGGGSLLYRIKTPCSVIEQGVWLNSVFPVFDLRLADGVDVADEVEHLVGEAPLVEGATAYPPLLASLARTSRLPDFTVFSALFSFKRSFLERCNIVFRCRTARDNFFHTYYTGRSVQDTSLLTLFVHRRTTDERLSASRYILEHL